MSQRPLVAVVDDDESVRESLPDMLQELGFATDVFKSAEDFLASARFGETQCLILDVAMPGKSGPELQQELKHRGERIPIIFISANRDTKMRQRLLRLGAVAYLFKPFSDIEILDAVRAALRG